MNIEQRVQLLEEELNIMKNDIKPVLLDIREQYLNMQNPFNDSIPMLNSKNDQADTNSSDNKDSNKNPSASALNNPIVVDSQQLNEKNVPSEQKQNSSEQTQNNPEQTQRNSEQKQNSSEQTQHISEEKHHNEERTTASYSSEIDSPGPEPDSYNIDTNTPREPNKRTSKNVTEPEKEQHQFYHFDTDHKADLIMIAGLTHWIEEATLTLGKDRVEALMEMACAMGRLSVELKDVIIKLARLSKDDDAIKRPITSKDYLALLTQLENLLGHAQPNDAALLSILSMMKETISG